MKLSKYQKLFDRAVASLNYWRELALTEYVVDLEQRMADRGLSRADLADRLKCSRANITKTLRGDANLTLTTLVKLAAAVDGVVHIHIADRNVATTWTDEPMQATVARRATRFWEATLGEEPSVLGSDQVHLHYPTESAPARLVLEDTSPANSPC
jgi:transcriptional regulator with XRE-family HTH domain